MAVQGFAARAELGVAVRDRCGRDRLDGEGNGASRRDDQIEAVGWWVGGERVCGTGDNRSHDCQRERLQRQIARPSSTIPSASSPSRLAHALQTSSSRSTSTTAHAEIGRSAAWRRQSRTPLLRRGTRPEVGRVCARPDRWRAWGVGSSLAASRTLRHPKGRGFEDAGVGGILGFVEDSGLCRGAQSRNAGVSGEKKKNLDRRRVAPVAMLALYVGKGASRRYAQESAMPS